MDQHNKKSTKKSEQFLYMDRWVDKDNFRAFVYDKDGNSKLANSYKEFEDLTTSGIWFSSKIEASLKPLRKHKDVALSDSK